MDGANERVKGVEPDRNLADSGEISEVSAAGVAKASVAVCPPVPADEDLRTVVAVWHALPVALRVGILAMVKAAT